MAGFGQTTINKTNGKCQNIVWNIVLTSLWGVKWKTLWQDLSALFKYLFHRNKQRAARCWALIKCFSSTDGKRVITTLMKDWANGSKGVSPYKLPGFRDWNKCLMTRTPRLNVIVCMLLWARTFLYLLQGKPDKNQLVSFSQHINTNSHPYPGERGEDGCKVSLSNSVRLLPVPSES